MYSDHKLVILEAKNDEIDSTSTQKTTNYIRVWKKYNKQALVDILRDKNWGSLDNLNTNDHYEQLNMWLLEGLNKLAPEVKLKSKESNYNWSGELVRMKRRKNNIWKKYKRTRDEELLQTIKNAEKQFRAQFTQLRKEKFRSQIKPNDPKSFWNKVNEVTGKNLGMGLPQKMSYGDKTILNQTEKADAFSEFFQEKVNTIVNQTRVEQDPDENYEQFENTNFMTEQLLNRAIHLTKPKNSYGFDRVPMRVLKDCYEVIKNPILKLLRKIYETKQIPDFWKIACITPIHKMGNKAAIENYRPISNLCSIAKIFERMILLRLQSIETDNNWDFTGLNQFGFKKKSSTTTTMLSIQAKISEFLENDYMVGMVSLDLSAAFDVVDHELLRRRMKKRKIYY